MRSPPQTYDCSYPRSTQFSFYYFNTTASETQLICTNMPLLYCALIVELRWGERRMSFRPSAASGEVYCKRFLDYARNDIAFGCLSYLRSKWHSLRLFELPAKAAETGVEAGNRRRGIDVLDWADAAHVTRLRARIRRRKDKMQNGRLIQPTVSLYMIRGKMMSYLMCNVNLNITSIL